MRLVVFGAEERVGECLVNEAVSEGHEVTTVCSPLGRRSASGGRVRALVGSMGDPGLVEAAFSGPEAVLWVASGLLLPKETELVRNVSVEMERRDLQRVIFLSGLSAAESRRRATLFSAVFLIRLFRGPGLHDGETQERYIRERRFAWTIIRPGELVDGPRTGAYRVGFGAADVPDNPRISYADAAGFMLRQVREVAYVRLTVDLFY